MKRDWVPYAAALAAALGGLKFINMRKFRYPLLFQMNQLGEQQEKKELLS